MEDMTATVALMLNGAAPADGGITNVYVLPAATSTRLGGVKVQADSGLKVDGEGNLSIDAATPMDTESVYVDDENQE